MSRCNDIRAGLDEWLDRQADEALMAEIEAHLAECGDCARYFAHHRRLTTDLAELGRAADRIAATAPAIASPQRRVPRWRAWASVAAAAVIVLGAGLYLVQSRRVERVGSLAETPTAKPGMPTAPATGSSVPLPARDADFHIQPSGGCLAVEVPSSNPSIHIVWLYPETRTPETPQPPDNEMEHGTPQ